MLNGVPAEPLAGKTNVAVPPEMVWTSAATAHAAFIRLDLCVEHGQTGLPGLSGCRPGRARDLRKSPVWVPLARHRQQR